jgi:hypothetical protein
VINQQTMFLPAVGLNQIMEPGWTSNILHLSWSSRKVRGKRRSNGISLKMKTT